jgi:hypothetical protein
MLVPHIGPVEGDMVHTTRDWRMRAFVRMFFTDLACIFATFFFTIASVNMFRIHIMIQSFDVCEGKNERKKMEGKNKR